MRILISLLFINLIFSDTILLTIKEHVSDVENWKIENINYTGYNFPDLIFKFNDSAVIYTLDLKYVEKIYDSNESEIHFMSEKYELEESYINLTSHTWFDYLKEQSLFRVNKNVSNQKLIMDMDNYNYQSEKNPIEFGGKSLKSAGALLLSSQLLLIASNIAIANDKLSDEEGYLLGLTTLALTIIGFIKLIDAGDKLQDYTKD